MKNTEIKQRHRFDCVPAVAAMITGRPIEEFDQFFVKFEDLRQVLNTDAPVEYFKPEVETQPGYTLTELKLYLLALGFSTGFSLEVEPSMPVLVVLQEGRATEKVQVQVNFNRPAILLDCEHRHMGFWTGDTFFDPGRNGDEFVLHRIIPIYNTNK